MRLDVREGSPSQGPPPALLKPTAPAPQLSAVASGPWAVPAGLTHKLSARGSSAETVPTAPGTLGVQASARALGEEGEATLSQIPLLATGHFLGV